MIDPLSIAIGTGLGAASTAAVMSFVRAAHARSYREEIEQRREERSVEYAGLAAKNDLLAWRIDELQQQSDSLLEKRDELLEELSQVSAKTSELRTKARRSKETLARLSEQLVVLPELDDLDPVDDQR